MYRPSSVILAEYFAFILPPGYFSSKDSILPVGFGMVTASESASIHASFIS